MRFSKLRCADNYYFSKIINIQENLILINWRDCKNYTMVVFCLHAYADVFHRKCDHHGLVKTNYIYLQYMEFNNIVVL